MTDYTPKLDEDQLFEAAHLMRQRGGGFASCIADAYFRADSHNKMRLLSAFGDLFTKFWGYVEESRGA